MTPVVDLSNSELIVHIGTGKTGSSSIQKTLLFNMAMLEKAGVSYFGLMCELSPERRYPWQDAGGWAHLATLDVQVARQQLIDVMVESFRQLKMRGIQRAVWSNETIFGNDRLIIPVLENLQTLGVRCRIIVYVRRHDAWARSAYLQWGIKDKSSRGTVKPFQEWYRGNGMHISSGLDPWLSRFKKNIAVRNFDACIDVAEDFLELCGMRQPEIVVQRENETPNAVALALWAIYNSQFESPVLPIELQRLLDQTGLLERAPHACDFNALLPTQGALEKIVHESLDDRNRVNAVLQEHGQPGLDTSPLEMKNMDVSQGEINAALLLMIKHQSDQIRELENKLSDPIRN